MLEEMKPHDAPRPSGALPGWVVDNDTSVRDEVAAWRGTPPAERWEMAKLCARDVLWALGTREDPERILATEDPLPESTVAALARLRQARGWGRGGP